MRRITVMVHSIEGEKAMTRPIVLAALCLSLIGAGAANAQDMTLTSADIKEGATIANEQVLKGFSCNGGNLSPALSWSGAPSATKSFAVPMFVPDAPTGSGWGHSAPFHLPPNTHSLPHAPAHLTKN